MPDPKVYAQINKFAVKLIFDAKFKAQAITAMHQAAEQAIRGKLTTDPTKGGKPPKGWSLDGTLNFLKPDSSGRGVDAQCSMAISTWPGKAFKTRTFGDAARPTASPGKVVSGDVEGVARDVVQSVMKAAVKYMESNTP